MAEKSQWKESISLEETNKIRVSLGLKPISEGPPAEKTQESIAEENYDRLKEAERRDREAAALKERLDKARNKSERAKKLVGTTLGAADDDDAEESDAKAWVRRQKKRQKELALKRAKELEEMDTAATAASYDERDLAGLRVAHGVDDFDEGEETILTLKDSRILDDEDDELHNVNMSEHAKADESVRLKKKGKQAYTGYDDDDFAEPGKRRSVLNKYDEDILGKQDDEGFRLGAPSTSAPSQPSTSVIKKRKPVISEEEREKSKLSMDYTKVVNTDYLREDEMTFKKPKKKKKPKSLRTGGLVEGAEEEQMDVDAAPAKLERQDLDATNLIDDDDLALSLARSRREANKKRIAEMKANAATNAPPLKDEETEQTISGYDAIPEQAGGEALVLDDTSEFVRNVSLAAERAKEEAARQRVKREASEANGIASVARIKSEPLDEPLGQLDGSTPSAHDDASDAEEGQVDDGVPMAVDEDADVKPKVEGDDEDAFAGTSGELLVSGGLASTLKILQHQGLVKSLTPEEQELERVRRDRDTWIAEQKARDRAREEEKRLSKLAGSSKDQQQREYENKLRAQREAQDAMKSFESYKPVVDIKYTDEFGRQQTPKEAWKHLSHQFHGKNSGNKKREKLLKKVEEERKREAMASGDTPTGTAAAFAARAERTGSATMVLSIGNKHGAPIQDERYGAVDAVGSLSKREGKGKAKAGAETAQKAQKPAVFNDIPMRPLPVNEERASTPTAPNGTSRDSTPGAAPRAGFAPVRSFAPAFADSKEGSPSTGEKLHIPLQVKRKAPTAEAEGSPVHKK